MNNLLVTGASGKLGQIVVKELLRLGEKDIIATTREPSKLETFKKLGVDVRAADFQKPELLVNSFKGAERLLLISTDAVGSRVADHKAAIEAAKEAGIKHIVYTSWFDPKHSVALVSEDHALTEKMIEESGMSFTILRNFFYTDNLLDSVKNAIKSGKLYGAAGTKKMAFVTREDCGFAAAAALRTQDNGKKYLDVTGPEAIGYSDLASLISEFSKTQITYVDLPLDDYKKGLVQAGLPGFVADLLGSFEASFKKGELEKATHVVEDLTSRKPSSVRDFLRQNLPV